MSELGKLSHKKKPRSKKFYQDMVNKRWGKKLSTPILAVSKKRAKM